DGQASSGGLNTIGKAAQTRSTRRIGTADTVVGDGDPQLPVAALQLDGCVSGARVLRDVRECLGTDKVGGGLDRRREALVERFDQDRCRSRCDKLGERRLEPSLGEREWVDPAREAEDVADGLLELLA